MELYPDEKKNNYRQQSVNFFQDKTVKLKLIEDDILVNLIEKIRVISFDGRVIEEFEGAEINPFYEIEISQYNDGLNFIEIQCNGERFVKKVIIDK